MDKPTKIKINSLQALLELVRAYQCGQFTRYKVTDVDVEEKATDLIQLLDILGNVMSKDFLTIGPLAGLL